MSRLAIRAAAALLCWLMPLHAAHADAAPDLDQDPAPDRLEFHNGDRVSGRLIAVRDGAAEFETLHGGTIHPALDAISGIHTAAPRALLFDDGTVREGRLGAGQAGAPAFEHDGEWREWPMETLAAIADAPEAFLPPEDAMPDEDEAPARPKRWSGSVESGLTMRRGNTDTLDFVLRTAAARKQERHTLDLRFETAYGKVEEVINTRRYLGEARWRVYPRERLYLYVLSGLERDDGRKLDLRWNAALGAGYDFIESERRSLSADIGLDYAHTRWRAFTPQGRTDARNQRRGVAEAALRANLLALDGDFAPGLAWFRDTLGLYRDFRDPLRGVDARRSDGAVSLRASAVFEQALFERAQLTEKLVLYPSLEDLGEFRAVSELAFTTPLSDSLGLAVTLKTEYDSLARRGGVNRWDNTLITSLRYTFK